MAEFVGQVFSGDTHNFNFTSATNQSYGKRKEVKMMARGMPHIFVYNTPGARLAQRPVYNMYNISDLSLSARWPFHKHVSPAFQTLIPDVMIS